MGGPRQGTVALCAKGIEDTCQGITLVILCTTVQAGPAFVSTATAVLEADNIYGCTHGGSCKEVSQVEQETTSEPIASLQIQI